MKDRIPLVREAESTAIPIRFVAAGNGAALPGLDDRERSFAAAQEFRGELGKILILPDEGGAIGKILFGVGKENEPNGLPLLAGKLAVALPAGTYRIAGNGADLELAALAFALGGYRFDKYRKSKDTAPRLVIPDGIDAEAVLRIAESVYLTRDLVNMPANDLGPAELAEAARAVAERFGAECSIVSGEELERGFPMIHAVGAGSDRPPCLVDIRWGAEDAPKVTLVGKGIVFDTGGLDIKPSSGMALMKKDMGGAANVLGLATMIMAAGLKLRLRVLLPVAENSISGRAFRPGDILRSRKGLTVEIGNTDAEGRLVLADALALAEEESPDLLVTMATLTGAARVATGPELPPFYTDDEQLAAEIGDASRAVYDPVWRLPFWAPYDAWLSSKVADVSHISSNAYAGSIVAALFLRRFVARTTPFVHFDIFAWNPSPRHAGAEGGEAQGIRALFHILSARYG